MTTPSTTPPDDQRARRAHRRNSRGGAIVWALILIGMGIWYLLRNLGLELPNMDQMWPIFVLLPGLGFLVGYLLGDDHDPGLAFVGTAATLLGIFFFMTTLGIGGLTESDMGRLWPVYLLIASVAFVVLWVASGFRDWGALVPAVITGMIGVLGLGAVMLGESASFARLLSQGWPVILILVGLGLLVGYFVQGKR